jgi:hypothetical protein
MTDISKQWLGEVDENNILLNNAGVLKAENHAGNGTVGILHVNASDKVVFDNLPQLGADPSVGNDAVRNSYLTTQLSNYQATSAKNQPSGYAGLDANGKILLSQVSTSVYINQGAWNANTNTPTLSDNAIAASVVVQDLTYSAQTAGAAGNSLTVAYTTGGTAGSEIVTVVANAISVQIESGVSTASQIKTAVDNSVAAHALVAVAISGSASNPQTAPVSATNLANGQDKAVNGWIYVCTVPGTASWMTDTGPKTFGQGDEILYNGIVWQHIPASQVVNSMAGSQTTEAPSVSAVKTALADYYPKVSGIDIGTIDAYSRLEIQNWGTNAFLRLGSLGADGDAHGDHVSDGLIVFNNNTLDTPMAGEDFGYARVKANRFGLYNSITSGFAGYIWRVDPTEMYWAKDDGTRTLTITRSTGKISFTPATSGNWSTVPSYVQDALDILAAEVASFQGANPQQEVLTLSSGDITAGYKDLSYVAINSIITLFPAGGPLQVPGTDYTLSTVSGKTRITFAGTLASTLIAGNVIVATYLK